MVVTPLHLKMGELIMPGDQAENVKIDLGACEQWIKKQTRQLALKEVKRGALKLSDLPVVEQPSNGEPTRTVTLDPAKFKICCPNAAGFLPLRQDWIDNMKTKLVHN